MSYQEQLVSEIGAVVERLEAEKKPLQALWITHEVCNEHQSGLVDGSEHADFWRHGGYHVTRTAARQYLNKRHGASAESADVHQPLLPGFDHVQQYYPVTRDGDDLFIAAMDLTDEEIEAKADMYEKMGRGCFAHADELIRFKSWRKTIPAVAAE